jgi:hypothetical protein
VPRAHRIAIAAAIIFLFAWKLAPPAGRAGPPMRDFEAYYAAGAAFDRGEDPYTRSIWNVERAIPGVDSSHEELLPYVGPAAALPLYGLLARLPYDPAHRVWGGFLGLMLGLALFGMLFLFRAPFAWQTLAGALFLCFGFGPLTSGVALGQVALPAFAGIVIAAVALDRKQTAAAACGAFIAALQPNLALALAARVRERRTLAAFGIGLIAFLALTLAAGGGGRGLLSYLTLLREHGAGERLIAIQITPAAIAWELGAGARLASIAALLVAAAALVACLALIRKTQRAEERIAVACCALPLILPFFHEHDFTIALFPSFLLALRARGFALGLGAAGTTFVSIDWLGLGQRPTGIPQSLAVALLAALGFALLARAQGRASLAGLAVCLVAFPIAAAALFHPVPIWPDALPKGFFPPAGLDASTIWHAEQTASGLEHQTPFWAFLKLCTLCGCGLLWTALAGLIIERNAGSRRDSHSNVDVQKVVERPELVGMKAD